MSVSKAKRISACTPVHALGVPKPTPTRRPTWQSERLSLITSLRDKGLSWREIGARIDLDPKYAQSWFAEQISEARANERAADRSNDNRPPIGIAGTPAMRAQRTLRGRGYIVVRLSADRYTVDGQGMTRAELIAMAGESRPDYVEYPEIPYFTADAAARYLTDFVDWDIVIDTWTPITGRNTVLVNGRAMTGAAMIKAARDHYYGVTGWYVPSRLPTSHNQWGRGVR